MLCRKMKLAWRIYLASNNKQAGSTFLRVIRKENSLDGIKRTLMSKIAYVKKSRYF